MANTLANRSAAEFLHPLVDVTVTTLGAGKTHTTTATGAQKSDTAGVSQTTQIGATLSFASSQTTQSGGVSALETLQLSDAYGDACRLYIVPPLDSAGNAVDCEVRPVVDGVEFDNVFNASAGLNDCMFPLPAKTIGMQVVPIGVPYRKALKARMSNLPLKATGWKYNSRLQFRVFSNLGWGTTAAPKTPLRLIVTGDLLDDPALTALDKDLQWLLSNTTYDPFGFTDKVQGFDAFSGVQKPASGHITGTSWQSLPNGSKQVGTGTQVFRFMRQAYNAIATTASDPFYLSTKDAVGGASDNVSSDYNDLGFNTVNEAEYTRLDLFSHRAAANQAFVGVRVGEVTLPTSKGMAATQAVNLTPGGNVQPIRPDSYLYFPMLPSPFPVACHKNKVVFFVTANGSAAIAAQINGSTLQDASQVAVGGIRVVPAAS